MAGGILEIRRLARQRSVLVEHRDRADVLALVIDELQELEQQLRGHRFAAGRRAGVVEDAGVDLKDRQQVVDVAVRVSGHLLRYRQLVLFQRAAQRVLADPQRRVAGDRDRQRRDRERQQRQLGEQLQGALPGSHSPDGGSGQGVASGAGSYSKPVNVALRPGMPASTTKATTPAPGGIVASIRVSLTQATSISSPSTSPIRYTTAFGGK